MYAFRCSDAGEGEDLEEWSLPTLLTFELAWSPEVVRRGSVGVMKKVLTVQFSARHANLTWAGVTLLSINRFNYSCN